MCNRILRHPLFAVCVVILAVLLPFVFGKQSSAANIPSIPENLEVITTLERAYEVLDASVDSLDFKQLSAVLINHPDYFDYIPTDELSQLKEYTRKVQGEQATKEFGYLTAMQTKRLNQQHGAKLLRAAREKARAEKREISKEELALLTEQNYGLEPYLPDENEPAQDVPFKRVLHYDSITVDGDRAEVHYDTGVRKRKAILVRIDGRCYVAGIF